jgi:hypothetical protein
MIDDLYIDEKRLGELFHALKKNTSIQELTLPDGTILSPPLSRDIYIFCS